MPCAAGELCQLPDLTPVAPVGHVCQGKCGGRLHGICGEVVTDNENHRICGACFDAIQSAKGGKRKEPAPPAPKGGGTTPPNLPKKAKQGTRENEKRTRLTLDQKVEVVGMLDRQLSQKHIAVTFDCGERTVRQIKKERKKLLEEHQRNQRMGAAQGGTKTKREGDFPEVDEIVLRYFETARVAKISVTRDVIMGFGREAKAELLAAAASSEDSEDSKELKKLELKKKLEGFKAGDRWAKGFVKRNGLASHKLYGDAGSVNPDLIKKEISDPKEAGGDESAKPGKLPPPAYAEVSTHFGALERAAEESGNGEAALYLSRAKMTMIAAHASKPSRQSDLREFF